MVPRETAVFGVNDSGGDEVNMKDVLRAPQDSARSRVFLSYSRADAPFARRLLEALEGRGVQAWIDWDDIPPSAEWWKEVERAIESSEAFVFALSPSSLSSPVCQQEIGHALKHNKRLIPVVCRDADTPLTSEAGAAIGRINWIFLRTDAEFATGIDRLVDAIETDLDWVREHSRLLVRAVEWRAHDRDRSFLLQQNDLAAAFAWLERGESRDPKPTALQSEYVWASRTEAARRRRRLMVGTSVAAGLILIAGGIAGWQALVSQTRAAEALSRRLAAQVTRAFDEDNWDLGLLLGIHATASSDTVEARQALFAGLERLRGVRMLFPEPLAADSRVALSPDGAFVAGLECTREGANDEDPCGRAELRVYRTADGTRAQQFSDLGVDSVTAMAFDPEAKRLAVAFGGTSPRVTFVSMAAGAAASTQDLTLGPQDGDVTQLAFASLTELVALSGDAGLMTWRIGASESQRTPLSGSALRTPAGRALVLAGLDSELGGAVLKTAGGGIGGEFQEPSFVALDGTRQRAIGVSCAVMASGRHCAGELRLFDMLTGRTIGAAATDTSTLDPMLAVAMSPDGTWAVTGGCGQNTTQEACAFGQLRFWQVGEDGLEPRGPAIRTYGGQVRQLAMSSDGRTIVSVSDSGRATVWRVDADLLTSTDALPSVVEDAVDDPATKGKQPGSNPCDASPAFDSIVNHVIAVVGASKPVCDALANDARPLSWTGNALAIATCSKNGNDSCAEGTVALWSVGEGRLRRDRSFTAAGEITAIASNGPDGRVAIARCRSPLFTDCTSGAAIDIVDASGANRTTVRDNLRLVSALAWAPGASQLAYATCTALPQSGPPVDNCAAGAVEMVDVASGQAPGGLLVGHRTAVSAMSFDDTGTLLATGDLNGMVAFWDATARQPLTPLLPVSYSQVLRLVFTAPDRVRATTEVTTREFRVGLTRWRMAACRLVKRPLTQAERERWLGSATAADPCVGPS
jgi:WD40 repeat protein